MKSCKDITMLISSAQDRELTKMESFSLKLHLFMCRYCRKYANNVSELRSMMQEYSQLDQLPETDASNEKKDV